RAARGTPPSTSAPGSSSNSTTRAGPFPGRRRRSWVAATRPSSVELETQEERRPVELALDVPTLVPVVEAEDLVVEVEAARDDLQPVRERVAALGVDLGVGIEVGVSVGSRQAPVGAVRVLIGPDRRRVVGDGGPERD